jgi:hypothetical protein
VIRTYGAHVVTADARQRRFGLGWDEGIGAVAERGLRPHDAHKGTGAKLNQHNAGEWGGRME